jgi:hypothetical protein
MSLRSGNAGGGYRHVGIPVPIGGPSTVAGGFFFHPRRGPRHRRPRTIIACRRDLGATSSLSRARRVRSRRYPFHGASSFLRVLLQSSQRRVDPQDQFLAKLVDRPREGIGRLSLFVCDAGPGRESIDQGMTPLARATVSASRRTLGQASGILAGIRARTVPIGRRGVRSISMMWKREVLPTGGFSVNSWSEASCGDGAAQGGRSGTDGGPIEIDTSSRSDAAQEVRLAPGWDPG